MLKLEGVIPAMLTPLKKNGNEIDFEALRVYTDFMVSTGVHGLFVCGTTGEGPLLSIEEKKAVSEVVIDEVGDQTKVIIQTGEINTHKTILLTQFVKDIGADAAGVVIPYFYGYDEKSLFSHFEKVARAVPDFPLFIYNIPQCAGNDLSPQLFAKLTDNIETISGIKTSSPDLIQFQEYLEVSRENQSIINGKDELMLAALVVGSDGQISGNGSVFPEPFLNVYEAFKRGNIEEARKHTRVINRLCSIFSYGRYPARFKKALELRGIKIGNVRSPHRELDSDEIDELKKNLENLKII